MPVIHLFLLCIEITVHVHSYILRMFWKFDSGVICLYPTMDEFRDFSGVVKYMETQGAQKYDVAKVSNLFFFELIAKWIRLEGVDMQPVTCTF